MLRPHETVEAVAAHEAPGTIAVAAYDDATGDLLGTGMITPGPPPDGWRVRGMAVAPDARGRGIGTTVLNALLQKADAADVERVWCNARLPAVNLYARAGFITISDEFEIPGIGPHYVMERRRQAGARPPA